MRKRIASILAGLLFLSGGLITSYAAQNDMLGTYACIAHRVVGIQTKPSGERYAGNIALTPEDKNFFITISHNLIGVIPRTAEGISDCRKFHEASDKKFKRVDPRTFSVWWSCESTFELTLSCSKRGMSEPCFNALLGDLTSRTPPTFYFLEPSFRSTFWLRDLRRKGLPWQYVYRYNLSSGGDKQLRPQHYLEEGICQKMEKPK